MKNTVLITGTSSGIGKATAKEFAKNGWNVIATMRNPANEKELTQVNNIFVAKLDVEQPSTIQKAIEAGIRTFGKIDVLINNAGQGLFGVFEATPQESIQRLFEVNVFGVMHVTKAILPHFRKQNRGVIVNVSSSTGLFTIPLLSVYSASKYALEGFSESLAFELSSQNIKIKLIEPGMVDTNFDRATMENYAADPSQATYHDYFEKMIKLFSSEDAGETKVTAEEVAAVIYHATTDDTDTLRYLIGDDVKAMMDARRALSDQEYIDMMRKRFTT